MRVLKSSKGGILKFTGRKFLDCSIDVFKQEMTRTRDASLCKFVGGSSIDEHGRLVDSENPDYSFQFDFCWSAEGTPNRNAELVSPNI
jgi:hypothetical protein